jgi:hypothetical protein
MPFFQDLEIIRNDVNSRNTSGNFNRQAGLTGRTIGNSKSPYESKTLQFPLDIGAADKAHYLMFNVNAQKKTQFFTETTNELPTVIANMQRLQNQRGGQSTNILNNKFNETAGNFLSKASTSSLVTAGIDVATAPLPTEINTFFKQVQNSFGNLGNDLKETNSSEFLRTIKRTKDTVVLYMPDKITYSNSQNYNELKLGGEVKSLAGASAAMQEGSATNLSTFAAFLAAEVSPVSNKELGAIATAVTQVVKNPMLEVMYTGVSLRKFNFSFSLWPRSEQEAIEVQKIIELLRFHQAPEIKQNTGGFFLIPPSEFDISFMYNGKVNPNMDAISTCVLTNIAVDYTPKGFHAYESIGSIDNPELGKTGMPVGIGLTLSFLETQIITKEYYKDYNRNSLINSSNNSFP